MTIGIEGTGDKPIGIARRDIKKDEWIDIFLTPNGFLYSEAIDFFNDDVIIAVLDKE